MHSGRGDSSTASAVDPLGWVGDGGGEGGGAGCWPSELGGAAPAKPVPHARSARRLSEVHRTFIPHSILVTLVTD